MSLISWYRYDENQWNIVNKLAPIVLVLAATVILSGCKNDQTVVIGETPFSIELPKRSEFSISDKELSNVIYTKLLAVDDDFSLIVTISTYFAISKEMPEYSDLLESVDRSVSGCPKGVLLDKTSAKIAGKIFDAVVCDLGENRKLDLFYGLLKNHHIIVGVESLRNFNTNELVSTISFE